MMIIIIIIIIIIIMIIIMIVIIIIIIMIIMLFPLHFVDINVSLFARCFGEKIILKPFLQMENMCTLSKKLSIFTNVLGINLI